LFVEKLILLIADENNVTVVSNKFSSKKFKISNGNVLLRIVILLNFRDL
jgi:hypothetical protein